MKKQFIYLFLLAIFSQGCDSCTSIKVFRTVTKTVTLTYPFNVSGGESNQSTSISSSQVFTLFGDGNTGESLERVDVTGVSLSGEINPQQNTANQAVISATITKNGGKFLLLRSTKMIKTGSTSLDTDLLGADGKYVTFNNALNSLNTDGLTIFREFFANAIRRYGAVTLPNEQRLDVTATSFVSPTERLVGTVYLRITASVTYYKCEPVAVALLYNDVECN
ncbi:MAG: hypothetical protein U0Y10_07690 [Spirosomataceae bacterium]